MAETSGKKTYIVTCAQRGAAPFQNFLHGLELCAGHYKGEIVIKETNGREMTSRRGEDNKEKEEIDPSLEKYRFVAEELGLNDRIDIKHFPVKAQQMIPLTSFKRQVEAGKTAIMASPKQLLICIPNSANDYTRMLVSTGAVTLPNYKDNRMGILAKLDHRFGAVIVEVDNADRYHVRVLNADKKGVFYDLGWKFDGKREPVFERPEAMVLGDWHEGYATQQVIDATEKMIRKLQPKQVVLHDLFDGDAINYFQERDFLVRAKQAMAGTDRLDLTLKKCGERLQWFRDISGDTKIVVVKSNHDERLDRYVSELRFAERKDHENAKVGCELFLAMLDGKDPLVEGIKKYYGNMPAGVQFLTRRDDYRVLGWALGVHGDLTMGKKMRLSAAELERGYTKIIAGHTHSPEIMRDVIRVGTCTPKEVEYTIGRQSDWGHAHALLPANGRPQLTPIVDGAWTCKD